MKISTSKFIVRAIKKEYAKYVENLPLAHTMDRFSNLFGGGNQDIPENPETLTLEQWIEREGIGGE